MITVLDYEISLKKCIEKFSLPQDICDKRKIIVDLALKCGINQYRFVAFDISAKGKILWNSSQYVIPSTDIVNQADAYLKKNNEVVINSMLTQTQKRELLDV